MWQARRACAPVQGARPRSRSIAIEGSECELTSHTDCDRFHYDAPAATYFLYFTSATVIHHAAELAFLGQVYKRVSVPADRIGQSTRAEVSEAH